MNRLTRLEITENGEISEGFVVFLVKLWMSGSCREYGFAAEEWIRAAGLACDVSIKAFDISLYAMALGCPCNPLLPL